MRGQPVQGAQEFGEAPPNSKQSLEELRLMSGSEDEPEGSAPRTALRMGVNFLWIVGFIVLTAVQMCRGG
jgi:hypothetical protein